MKYGNRKRNVWSSTLLLIVLVVILVILLRGLYGIRQKALITAKRLDEARVSYDELKMHAEELQARVSYLSTDQGIESELRSKFRAAAEGESVAVIIDDNGNKHDNVTASSTEPTSFWSKIWRFVTGGY